MRTHCTILSCTIQYTVIDDEEIEGTEQFEVTWYSQLPRVTFKPPIFQLTIEDNDGKMYRHQFFKTHNFG